MEGTGCPGSRSDDDLVTCPLRPGPLIGPVISRDLSTGLWLARCQLSPEAPQRWRLAHWEGRDIYFVFTTHRAGKYTNNPASLSQYLWGQSSHNWLKTKQCVVHSLNSRKFTTKKYIFSAEFTTISWRVIYDKCGHKYCHWVADSTKNICPSDGKY